MNTKHIHHQIRTATVAIAMVTGGMITAGCGTETGATEPPPIEARIYPPTDVPEVTPGAMIAGAAERRAAQNEEKMRRAGGRVGMP